MNRGRRRIGREDNATHFVKRNLMALESAV
jgi:hypothetical protein